MTKARASIEHAKIERRGRIIDAAEDLIRASGTTSFSMHSLARHAGLSTNTTYNLIGSKAAVLYTLLNRSVLNIGAARRLAVKQRDPLQVLLHAGDTAAAVFASEPGFYRPLLRFLFSAEEPGPRMEFMQLGHSYWSTAVDPLDRSGKLQAAGINADDIARDMLVYFTGATEFWVHDDLNADEFRAQVVQGISLRLLSIADEHDRKQLVENISLARSRVRTLSDRGRLRSVPATPQTAGAVVDPA